MLKAIYELFFGKRFEFYSPYTLEDSHQRLQDASERDKRKPSIARLVWGIIASQYRYFLLITVESISSKSFSFRADRVVSGGMAVKAYGEVYEDNTDVRVTGMVQIGLFTRLFLLFWLLLWIVIFFLFLRFQFRLMPLFFLICTGLVMLSIKADQNKMYNTIHETIGKSKKKISEGV